VRRLLLIPVLLAAAAAPSFGAADDLMTPTISQCAPPKSDADPGNVPLDERTIVSPVVIEAEVQPGDRIHCVITIRNRHKAPHTTFTFSTEGLTGSHAHNTDVRFIDPADPDAAKTAASWVVPGIPSITLAPRQVAAVPITITVPADPPRGGVFASFEVSPKAATSAGDTNVRIDARVAVPILLRVGGTGTPKLSLHDVHAPQLRWNRDPWTLRAKLDNDGTLHATPSGRVRVRSLFGNTVADLHVDGRPLLPGGRQPVIETWRGVPWLGFYRYDLRLTDSTDTGGNIARAHGWFVALPPWWVLVLAALVLSYAVVGGIARRRRRVVHRWEADHDDASDDPHGPHADVD
jgi:hypothetical protein